MSKTSMCQFYHMINNTNTAQSFRYFLIVMFFSQKEQNIMNEVAIYKNSSLLVPV